MSARIFAAFLICLVAGCADMPSKGGEQHTGLKFGLVAVNSRDEMRVTAETRVIPKRVDTALPYYGFELIRSDSKPYTVQLIHFLPGPPAVIKGDLVSAPQDWAKGIKSPTYRLVGNFGYGYSFNAGDPIGRYRLVLVIDGSEAFSVDYEIVDSQ